MAAAARAAVPTALGTWLGRGGGGQGEKTFGRVGGDAWRQRRKGDAQNRLANRDGGPRGRKTLTSPERDRAHGAPHGPHRDKPCGAPRFTLAAWFQGSRGMAPGSSLPGEPGLHARGIPQGGTQVHVGSLEDRPGDLPFRIRLRSRAPGLGLRRRAGHVLQPGAVQHEQAQGAQTRGKNLRPRSQRTPAPT